MTILTVKAQDTATAMEEIVEKLGKDSFIIGTKKIGNSVYSNGSRVLNFVSLSKNLLNARKKIHNNLKKLNWIKGFFRKDIAFKVIKK